MEGIRHLNKIYPISDEIYVSELQDSTIYLILQTPNLKRLSSEKVFNMFNEIFEKYENIVYCGLYIENFI